MGARYLITRGVWAGLYLCIVVGPVFLLLVGRTPAVRGFWWEFASALGFASVSMMGMQFALTARFKRATAPFGIDIIYHFHKYIGLAACAFVVAHPAAIFLRFPGTAALLNPFTTPGRFRAGILSALALIALAGISLLRRRLAIEYDCWRLWHLMLAVAAVLLAIWHIAGIGYYTQEPWKRAVWGGLALAWAALVVFVRVIKPIRLLRRPYEVVEIRPERGDNWTLRLRPVGHGGIRFLPGQFAWVSMWSSPFRMKEHPFSIASSAEAAPVLEFTIKERGDFTRRIKTARPGDRVYVDAPYGSFSTDRYEAEGYVFIAGGIGIAPMMSMLRTFADRGDRRPILLFYANKQWERAAFREELEALKQKINLRVVHVLESPHEGWDGESGFLDAAMIDRHLPADRGGLEYFICGPDAMMASVEKSLRRLGVPIRKFHSELFNLV